MDYDAGKFYRIHYMPENNKKNETHFPRFNIVYNFADKVFKISSWIVATSAAYYIAEKTRDPYVASLWLIMSTLLSAVTGIFIIEGVLFIFGKYIKSNNNFVKVMSFLVSIPILLLLLTFSSKIIREKLIPVFHNATVEHAENNTTQPNR
ncbi:hypothetical protein [Komagataeibacter nataicola]|uniref:hypothetical protein n=1 Tax=Komagataeibacter nataicola TaxID=265960 RepID=UPI0011B4B3B6|nr:hypothetical protein [Komagataeibacter nataicola]WNM07305.1 hypothetical protein RI056_00240 [Komagataeibacter nataicola]